MNFGKNSHASGCLNVYPPRTKAPTRAHGFTPAVVNWLLSCVRFVTPVFCRGRVSGPPFLSGALPNMLRMYVIVASLQTKKYPEQSEGSYAITNLHIHNWADDPDQRFWKFFPQLKTSYQSTLPPYSKKAARAAFFTAIRLPHTPLHPARRRPALHRPGLYETR